MKKKKNAYTYGNCVLDLLFPPRCPLCDEVTGGSGICPECIRAVRFVEEPFCLTCGKPLTDAAAEYCGDCQKTVHRFDKVRSVLVYDGPVKQSVYRFKYGGRKEYARVYADLTAQHLCDFIREVSPDLLIPVPLHAGRMRKRGYNQAALYARRLGKLWGIPCREDLVVRVKNTRPQKELDRAARQNNLKKAFKMTQNDVKLKTIILVDDIYTTGSTMDAMAELLAEAQAEHIYGISLACGKPD